MNQIKFILINDYVGRKTRNAGRPTERLENNLRKIYNETVSNDSEQRDVKLENIQQ